jgi:hypothetical protein
MSFKNLSRNFEQADLPQDVQKNVRETSVFQTVSRREKLKGNKNVLAIFTRVLGLHNSLRTIQLIIQGIGCLK